MYNNHVMSCLMQMVAICNMIISGWHIKKIGNSRYEIQNNLRNIAPDFNLEAFIHNILSVGVNF